MGGPVLSGPWSDGYFANFIYNRRSILEDGAIFGEIADHVHVNSKILPAVAFSDGCRPVRGNHVVNTLSVISEQVSEIIESFSPEFG